MPEHALLLLTLIAGIVGFFVGADLARRGSKQAVSRLIAAGCGSAVGAAALWLFFQGLATVWHGGSWLGVVAILGALLALTIGLRRVDEHCPSCRSISNYCCERDRHMASRS